MTERDYNSVRPTVPLRDYIERIFEEKQKALEIAFRAQQEALAIATKNMELRLEKLNDLRNEVMTDRALYLKRDQYDAEAHAREMRLSALEATYVKKETFDIQIEGLRGFQNRLIGIGTVVVFLSAAIGVFAQKLFG